MTYDQADKILGALEAMEMAEYPPEVLRAVQAVRASSDPKDVRFVKKMAKVDEALRAARNAMVDIWNDAAHPRSGGMRAREAYYRGTFVRTR